MPLLKTCANNSRHESVGDLNDCYGCRMKDARLNCPLCRCVRDLGLVKAARGGNGWVLKKFSQELPQPSIGLPGVCSDNLGQASQDPSKVPHWVQAAKACPPLFADLSLLIRPEERAPLCSTGRVHARARSAIPVSSVLARQAASLGQGKMRTCSGLVSLPPYSDQE